MDLDLNKAQSSKSLTFALKVALVFAAFTLVLQFGYKLLGVHPELNQDTSGSMKYLIYFLNYVPYFFAIYMVQRKYSSENQTFNYLNRFSAGFKAVGFIAIFASLVLYFYFKFISPEVFEKMKEMAIQSAGKDTVLLRNARKTSQYIGVINLFGSVFGYLIVGIPLSLISALFISNKS